jgi:hypothetical protein
MKTGKTLQELYTEIVRQRAAKKDFVASTAAMRMTPEGNLALGSKWEGGVSDLAHDHISDHVKIPRAYYNRMRSEAPDLLATNVDRWFAKYPAPRMVRTMDQGVRAFLSNSYRPLENHDLANAILPVLINDRKMNIMSCEITERRLYIKAVDEKLFRDVPVGFKMGDGSHRLFDTCAPAIIVSNSEVGCGRLVVDTGVFTKACTNMALFADGGMKRTHLGARHQLTEQIENIDHLLSERTKRKTDEALWMQVRDVVKSAFDPEKLTKRVEKITAAAQNKITAKVDEVMELAADHFSLNDDERDGVLKHLIEGGKLTQYGLSAAITRAAQDVESYDRSTELEYLGGQVIELNADQWSDMAQV